MRILWIGNNPGRLGGQNRVAFFTIRELQKLGYQVFCAGKGTQVLDEHDGGSPCPCFSYHESEPLEKLHQIIDQVKPDGILASHDTWCFYYLQSIKQKYPHIPIVGWYTIDAHPIHASWFPILRATDYICVPTQFGKDTIYQRWPEKPVEVVRYGVDLGNYQL